MKQSLIYIEKNEEITSVMDKIRKQKNREIFLVVPKEANILQGFLNLQLLNNQTKFLNKKIILITKDKIGQELARRIGIEAKKDIEPKIIKQLEQLQVQEEQDLQGQGEEEAANTGQTKKQVAVLDIVKRSPKNLTIAKRDKSDKKLLIQPRAENKSGDLSLSDVAVEEEKQEKLREKQKKLELLRSSKEGFPYQKMQKLFSKNKNKLEKLKKIQSLVKKSKAREKSFNKSKVPSWVKYVLTVFAILVFLIAFSLVFLLLPKAEVKINLAKKPIRENLEVLVAGDDSNLENETLLPFLPGHLTQETKKEERIFKATGKQTFSNRAQGEVVFINSNSVSQVLVEKTRLLSPEGLIFRTKKRVTIPAAQKNQQGELVPGTIEAEVTADTLGEQGCIQPTKFTIASFVEKNDPRAKTILAESKQAFQGCREGEQIVVSENDIDAAKNIIEQALRESFAQEIKNNFSQSSVETLEKAVQIKNLEFSSDKEVGDVAENFTMQAQGDAFFMLFDENQLFDISSKFLSEKIAADETLVQDVKEGISYEIKSFNEEKQKITLGIILDNQIEKKIDSEEISTEIKGKNLEEAKKIILANDGVESVEFILSPFWVNKIPKFNNKIYIYKN